MTRQALKIMIPLFTGVCLLFAAVKTDYDHQADFSKYKTYSWISARGSNDLWSERILQDVDAQLQSKGWSKVESGGDATVSAFGRTQEEQSLETYYNGFGGGWRWRGFGDATTVVENTPVGSLTVDVFDAQTKRLVWRGSATDTLSGEPEKNAQKLQHAVADMFKHFPPVRG